MVTKSELTGSKLLEVRGLRMRRWLHVVVLFHARVYERCLNSTATRTYRRYESYDQITQAECRLECLHVAVHTLKQEFCQSAEWGDTGWIPTDYVVGQDRISFFECFFQIAMISTVVSPREVYSRRVHEGCAKICSGCVWKTAGTEAFCWVETYCVEFMSLWSFCLGKIYALEELPASSSCGLGGLCSWGRPMLFQSARFVGVKRSF